MGDAVGAQREDHVKKKKMMMIKMTMTTTKTTMTTTTMMMMVMMTMTVMMVMVMVVMMVMRLVIVTVTVIVKVIGNNSRRATNQHCCASKHPEFLRGHSPALTSLSKTAAVVGRASW